MLKRIFLLVILVIMVSWISTNGGSAEISTSVIQEQEIYHPTFNNASTLPLFPTPMFDGQEPSLSGSDVTDVPNCSVVADPFLFKDEESDAYGCNLWYLFVETLGSNPHGKISVATSSDDGYTWEYQQVVLEEPFHLSYPQVFKSNGEYYMIPETHQDNSVRLYKATNFPYQWEFQGKLLSGHQYIDSSITYHNGKWWLFTNPTTESKDVYVYYSDNLQGGWTSHPQNPVVHNDQAYGRGAGRIFNGPNNELYRLSQRVNFSYGEATNISRITELTTTAYQEEELYESPLTSGTNAGTYSTWNSEGMHHVDPWWDGTKWIIAVDGEGHLGYATYIYTSGGYLRRSPSNDFANIASVTVSPDQTDYSQPPYFLLPNLIEGPGVGFETESPYITLSNLSWSTVSTGYLTDYFDTYPDQIELDFTLEEMSSINAFSLWHNVYQFGNTIRSFTLQFSDTGDASGLGTKQYFTAKKVDSSKADTFMLDQTYQANFVRLTVIDNYFNYGQGIGPGGIPPGDVGFYPGDRVGLQEVAFHIE